jgi:hypothetical protein
VQGILQFSDKSREVVIGMWENRKKPLSGKPVYQALALPWCVAETLGDLLAELFGNVRHAQRRAAGVESRHQMWWASK